MDLPWRARVKVEDEAEAFDEEAEEFNENCVEEVGVDDTMEGLDDGVDGLEAEPPDPDFDDAPDMVPWRGKKLPSSGDAADEEEEEEAPDHEKHEQEGEPFDDLGEELEPDGFDVPAEGAAPDDEKWLEEEQAGSDEEAGDADADAEGLADVPDHLQEAAEAVEGNLELKRALSAGPTQLSDDVPPAKRRRGANCAIPQAPSREAVRALLASWRLESDRAVKYVLKHSTAKEVEAVRKSGFRPAPRNKRSFSEQVYEQIKQVRERELPPSGSLDVVAAFGWSWRLDAAEIESLRELGHGCLQQTFVEYDTSRPLTEVVEEASAAVEATAEANGNGSCVKDRLGPFTCGRAHRLELIDPFADALVVGDANLTFSLKLADHRKALSHSGQTVATTFERFETLRQRYGEIGGTVKQLQKVGAEVIHDVDCTRLVNYPRFQDAEGKFGAVYYNFPHAGVVQGFYDGHPYVRWRHANLMALFFRSLRSFVKKGGSVKVASNSRATGVRYSDIIEAATANEFQHVETFPFLEWQLRDYRRSYGDRRDKVKRPEDGEVYNAQRASSDMVYCFRFAPSGNALPPPRVVYPPSKLDLFLSSEGRLPERGTVARKRRVEELYELFLSYVEGVHVG